jgi:hypothetical protein
MARTFQRVKYSRALVAGLLMCAGAALAKDYPPSPIDPKVVALSPTSIDFVLHLPRWCPDSARFEIEETINGVRQSANQETQLSQSYSTTTDTNLRYVSGGRDCSAPYDFPLGGLTPETEYCFRAWTRTIGTGVRSLFASVWACARTPPHPPLAPLDVRAVVVSKLADSPPHISWSTPDQSNHRGIAHFIVERQSPPGANRPWIFEQDVAGPSGAQSASTRLAFAIVGSKVDLGAKHVYRVCSVNDAARICAAPVEIATAPDTFGANAAQNGPGVAQSSPAAQARNAGSSNWTASSPAQAAKQAQPAASSALGRPSAIGSAPASALQSRP